jgi:hypothetical protein
MPIKLPPMTTAFLILPSSRTARRKSASCSESRMVTPCRPVLGTGADGQDQLVERKGFNGTVKPTAVASTTQQEIKVRSGTAHALSAAHDAKSTYPVPVTRQGGEAAECRAKPILEIVPPRPAAEHHILSRGIASETVSIQAR